MLYKSFTDNAVKEWLAQQTDLDQKVTKALKPYKTLPKLEAKNVDKYYQIVSLLYGYGGFSPRLR